ncbi:MAG: hypothetical protein QOI76_2277, partial [Frankiales bacterium]|nr:hypothetical protein [Frankiales bacterium]
KPKSTTSPARRPGPCAEAAAGLGGSLRSAVHVGDRRLQQPGPAPPWRCGAMIAAWIFRIGCCATGTWWRRPGASWRGPVRCGSSRGSTSGSKTTDEHFLDRGRPCRGTARAWDAERVRVLDRPVNDPLLGRRWFCLDVGMPAGLHGVGYVNRIVPTVTASFGPTARGDGCGGGQPCGGLLTGSAADSISWRPHRGNLCRALDA